MARVEFNPHILSISGKLGGLVIRRYADGSMSFCRPPRIDTRRVPSPAQARARERFKEASVRCRLLMQDPGTLAAYRLLNARRRPKARLNATIIADILRAPLIGSLDVKAYRGQPGRPIRVIAGDSVAVRRLALTILDRDEARVIETAEKLFDGDELAYAVEWTHTTTVTAPPGHSLLVTVAAFDLAGNRTEKSEVQVVE